LLGDVASYVLKESGIPVLLFKPKQTTESPLEIIKSNKSS
jgi:hypothetical protein